MAGYTQEKDAAKEALEKFRRLESQVSPFELESRLILHT